MGAAGERQERVRATRSKITNHPWQTANRQSSISRPVSRVPYPGLSNSMDRRRAADERQERVRLRYPLKFG